MRAGVVKQAQSATLEFQIYDPSTLTPVDLTAYDLANGAAPTGPQPDDDPVAWVKMRFMEASGVCGLAYDATIQNIDDATNGIISASVPNNVIANSGIYNCECGVFDPTNNMLFSNTCYVLVERGLFTLSQTKNPSTSGIVGPPTLAEIRLNLRDQPELNRLIDEYEFDAADICDAVLRTCMYFNMTQPPISIQFSTVSFPWRYQWMDGIAAHLYEVASSYYRRNYLKHQNAGLQIDDLNREREYMQAMQLRMERWIKWVQMKKVELNMQEGFGHFGSPYLGYATMGSGGW